MNATKLSYIIKTLEKKWKTKFDILFCIVYVIL